jgi:hypothetical protein
LPSAGTKEKQSDVSYWDHSLRGKVRPSEAWMVG